MNLQSGDNKCFQYAMTVALIKKKKKQKKKKNNLEIALNVLYTKDAEILPASISSHNSIREK